MTGKAVVRQDRPDMEVIANLVLSVKMGGALRFVIATHAEDTNKDCKCTGYISGHGRKLIAG
jgi:hypothetical protein